MMFNTGKAAFGLFLFSAMTSLASGTPFPDPGRCPFTENPGNRPFCFAVVLEIEGLQFEEVCTRHRAFNLEQALLEYHNDAIDCACPNNQVTYTDVTIIPGEFETLEGDPGDLDFCRERNSSKRGRRTNSRQLLTSVEEDLFNVEKGFSNAKKGLSKIKEGEVGDRKLRETPVTRVVYTSTGNCGRQCPNTPFPGSSSINSNNDSENRFPFLPDRRQLTGNPASECFEPLFVEILNSNGFENVIGVEVIRGSVEDPALCPVPPPPVGKKGSGKKGSGPGKKGSGPGKKGSGPGKKGSGPNKKGKSAKGKSAKGSSAKGSKDSKGY
mmetsp:Transcript_10468/g.15531  ORF Transcript_10468/g.15531 Transcript_10468/m.15531 type:complete len:325 (+) Transcript_10468:109-1083(+)